MNKNELKLAALACGLKTGAAYVIYLLESGDFSAADLRDQLTRVVGIKYPANPIRDGLKQCLHDGLICCKPDQDRFSLTDSGKITAGRLKSANKSVLLDYSSGLGPAKIAKKYAISLKDMCSVLTGLMPEKPNRQGDASPYLELLEALPLAVDAPIVSFLALHVRRHRQQISKMLAKMVEWGWLDNDYSITDLGREASSCGKVLQKEFAGRDKESENV